MFFHSSSLPQSFHYICGTPLLLPQQHILVSPMRSLFCACFSHFYLQSHRAFLEYIFLANCADCAVAICRQFVGQELMLVKANKAWGACGKQRGSVFKGRSEPTSAFVWQKECQESGLFQKTLMHPAPFGQIIAISAAWDGWWEISVFLSLLMSNGAMSICWQASGNFHFQQTVHSATGCYNPWAGGTRSADYSLTTACSSDSVKVSLPLN